MLLSVVMDKGFTYFKTSTMLIVNTERLLEIPTNKSYYAYLKINANEEDRPLNALSTSLPLCPPKDEKDHRTIAHHILQ